jgi:hypothetical protein
MGIHGLHVYLSNLTVLPGHCAIWKSQAVARGIAGQVTAAAERTHTAMQPQ